MRLGQGFKRAEEEEAERRRRRERTTAVAPHTQTRVQLQGKLLFSWFYLQTFIQCDELFNLWQVGSQSRRCVMEQCGRCLLDNSLDNENSSNKWKYMTLSGDKWGKWGKTGWSLPSSPYKSLKAVNLINM